MIGAVAADLGTPHHVRSGDREIAAGPDLVVEGKGCGAVGAVAVGPHVWRQVGEPVVDHGARAVRAGDRTAGVDVLAQVDSRQGGEGIRVRGVVKSPVTTIRRVRRCRRRIFATALGNLVAKSWTSTGTGILTAGYRSVGSGLQGPALQRLREQVGWVIPIWCTRVPAGGVVTCSDPTAPLAATLLLIAQQLAHTTAVPVDDRVRKAYRRRGRHEPEVRLVRIRGSNSTARRAGDDSLAPGGGPAGREHRWWVRGHWRRQPYGPGRTQRRLIYINPQLRGPQDKPIKATSTVRILGRHDFTS